jgi:hypothetical protein
VRRLKSVWLPAFVVVLTIAVFPAVAAADSAPVNTSPPTISGASQDGKTLTGSPGAWSASPSPAYSYRWQRCDSTGANCVGISAATSTTYKLTHADVGNTIALLVTARNSAGTSSAVSAATAVIAAAPPSDQTAPTISGTAQIEQTLTAASGNWNGTPPLSYTYQWRRCDSTGAACAAISGATSTTHLLVSADVGHSLRVYITATNSVGSSSASSHATAVVTSAPVNTSAPTISGTAQAGQTLTAGPGLWSAYPPASYAYQWLSCDSTGTNCNQISGATSNTYAVTTSDVGATVRVAVTASNSLGSAVANSADSGVVISAASDIVVAAAGDIACDPLNTNFNNGFGTTGFCQAMATSNLLVKDSPMAILPLGDDQYECGSLSAFQNSYGSSWGRLKQITYPVPGNHEYQSTNPFGGTGCSNQATGYFSYFGSVAGSPGHGYYSYNLGTWHIIALNTSNQCSNVPCAAGSAQETWLKNDLAAHPAACTLAYWHQPLFTSENAVKGPGSLPFWQDLYAAGADVILNGHAHNYERFDLQSPGGVVDPAGIREFVVGTGGDDHANFSITPAANSQVRNSNTFGVLKLTLHADSYSWQFVPAAGSVFTDSGTTGCHH